MANFYYLEALRAMAAGELNFGTNTFRMIWVKAGTSCATEDTANDMDAFTNEVEFNGGGGYPATRTGIELDNPSITEVAGSDLAYFTTDAEVVTAVGADGEVVGIVIFKWTGTYNASVPIAYIDTGTNIPFTPNGGDITVTPNAGGLVQFQSPGAP